MGLPRVPWGGPCVDFLEDNEPYGGWLLRVNPNRHIPFVFPIKLSVVYRNVTIC